MPCKILIQSAVFFHVFFYLNHVLENVGIFLHYKIKIIEVVISCQPPCTYSKLTAEKLEKGPKNVPS